MNRASQQTHCDALLVHPAVIGALALWLINDHVLKQAYPNWWTGKLSDVAGMVVFPVFVGVVLQTVLPRARSWSNSHTLLFASTLTVIAFTAVKLTPIGALAYQWGLGIAQWPWHAATAWATHGSMAPLRAVKLAMDPSDLVTLPFAFVAGVLLESTVDQELVKGEADAAGDLA